MQGDKWSTGHSGLLCCDLLHSVGSGAGLGCQSLAGQGNTTQDCVGGLEGDLIFFPDSSFCFIFRTWVNKSIFGSNVTTSCSDGKSGARGTKLGMLPREKGSCSCSSSPWLSVSPTLQFFPCVVHHVADASLSWGMLWEWHRDASLPCHRCSHVTPLLA